MCQCTVHSQDTTKYYKITCISWREKIRYIGSKVQKARDIFRYLKVHSIAAGKSSINTIVTRYKQEDKTTQLTQFYDPHSDGGNEHGLSIVVPVIVPISVTWLPSFLVSSSALKFFSAKHRETFPCLLWGYDATSGKSDRCVQWNVILSRKMRFPASPDFDLIDTTLSQWTTAFSVRYVAWICLSNDGTLGKAEEREKKRIFEIHYHEKRRE